MAEMTPDYEIGDDVMYASDQRSVGIPAKVLALTAPNGNQNYLQIKTAEGAQVSDYVFKMRPLKEGMPCICSNNISKEAYIKSVDVAGSLCNVEYATVNGLDTQYDVDLKYIYGRPKKADGSSCTFIDSNADFNNCHAIERDAVVQYRNTNDDVESRERATVVHCYPDNTYDINVTRLQDGILEPQVIHLQFFRAGIIILEKSLFYKNQKAFFNPEPTTLKPFSPSTQKTY